MDAVRSGRICDHHGLDHDQPFSYCGPCPACGVCKFIGHGPLCLDCYTASATPPERRCWRSECRVACYYPQACSERPAICPLCAKPAHDYRCGVTP